MHSATSRLRIAVFVLVMIWMATAIWGGRGSGWDLAVYKALYVGGGTTLAANAAIFTGLGSGVLLISISLVAAVVLVIQRKRRAALFLFIVFMGRLLVELEKLAINRPRPGVSPHLVAVDSYSFPSGHAANSTITFLAIALLIPVRQRNRAIAVGIALALALQVGTSRTMLGVHWPSDVIGGWAFGLAWIIVCMQLANSRPGNGWGAAAR